MSSQIIGNTEYNSIKEKAYINGKQENIMQLAAELDKAGINYSGRVSNYRSSITVEAADRARTLEIMKGILNAEKKNIPAENTEKNIIGNAEYRYIPNKRYVRGETEAMLRTADRLTAENISFSGRINGDIVTLTVSGDDVQELAKKYFAEEKNRIENIQSAYFLALASDTFEDGYYISEVNATTGEEIAPYRSNFGDISMFISVDSAISYAEAVGVTLSNSHEQLDEWRRIEIEAEKEKDRQLNLSRSREIKKRLPISENGYEELFVLRENTIDWIYFNPDGADGEGQFVVTSLYANDILNAYIARTSTDVHNSQSAFIEAIENGRQTVINADTEEFERYALSYITSRNKDNVIVSAPIVSGNGYNDNFQNIINTLESFFGEVHSYKENHITHESDNISIEGHIGTWYVIDSEEIEGKKLFLLEHEEYGDSAASIIVDENKNLVMEDVWNGFDDYRDSLEFDDGKQHISNDMAVDMWGHGFPIYINERDTLMIDTSENAYELFRNDNNNFYASDEYIAQERYLSNTVTGLDKLNDIAVSEASLAGKEIDTVADYAKDMYEDGEIAYKWSDGLTEWENLAASILSGDTEYIHRWIEDLPSALPALEDNSGFSIESFYSNLVNYEKQYGRISEEEMKVGTQFVYDNANWEVVLVNSNVLSLKKLESENGMDSLIIEDWQNTIKRSEIEFIEEKSSIAKISNSGRKTLIINAFGGPGAGKSTACLHITSELKKRGYIAEYVSEYAKDLVWDKNFDMLDGSEEHQKMILAEQKKRIDRLVGQVDFVVTDSPLLHNSIYVKSDNKDNYTENLFKLFNQYNNFNVEVIRDYNNFEQEGRIHNLEQSQKADSDIRTMLDSHNIYYGTYSHSRLDTITNNTITTFNKLPDTPSVAPDMPDELSLNSPLGNNALHIETPESSIEGYNLKNISDFVHDFSTDGNLRKETYTAVAENVDISLSIGEKDSFEIYQLKDGDEYRDKRFVAISALNGKPNFSDYNLVYSGNLSELNIAAENSNDILENIFSKFNMERPEDFKGHSLSISDVIVLHRNSEDTAHYVDTTGYVDIPEFIKERDLAPIDKQPEKENTPVENNVIEQSNIHFGLLGNGITCYDISKMDRENNDHLTVAHISEEGIVRYYVDDLSESDKKQIESHAAMQKKKFTEEWDKLPPERKYVIIYEKIYSTGTKEQIRFFDSDYIPNIADKVQKYERSIIFKDEGFPTEKTHNDLMNRAFLLINEYSEMEFESSANFSNLAHVNLAYTTHEVTEAPIEVYADLVTFCLVTEYDGKVIEKETFSSLEEMCGRLGNLEFDELIAIDDTVAELSKGTPLKTVTNEYNSYLIVQDVVYALQEILDMTPENYDWNNYVESFKKVLDCNINTGVAMPLYKSRAERILQAAANGEEIQRDEVHNAITDLEYVLQNSIMLENPEDTIEQISFFGGTPNRVSSDEIHYTSSAAISPQIDNSPVGNPQENTAEKKITADFTITDENYGAEGGAKTRFRNNVEAIKLLKTIESENRAATPDEQKILSKYVGWGGIPQAFDSRKTDWNNEYTELKNLLSFDEYAAARASTLNAHYTTPTVINAVYSALDNMGFSGGKIIEPAMGIGNFFGAMPENMRNNSDLYGVELDSITGRIAQQLYQSANIQITGYEKTEFSNDSFDIAVGNVPFGSYKVNDKDYNKQNMFIHDYFFSKTLDKVRPGGIVAFVTSKGTLDKENPDVRKYLAERAELLGAIRLPNNAFRANAGTEVTSDIIFLQKRERPISIEENPPEWVYKDMLDNGIAVNKYFADHPEMILGKMVEGNKLYGNQTDASMCIPIEGSDLKEQLAAAIKNITGTYKEAEKEKTVYEDSNSIPCPPDSPKFSFIVQDDILYYRKAERTMTKVEASDNNINRIKAMVQLRDSVHNLLELQLNNVDGTLEADIISAQKELNSQYDNFSEKYGLVSSNENKRLFNDDSSYHLIKSLEKIDSDGKFIGKADIFSKKTVNPKIVVDHCDNASDALILSLSEKMCVNLEYMSILTGKTEEELIFELGNKIYQNPQKDMRWESADEYLTGNIRAKLAAAEAAGIERNAEALRAVIPQRIEAADIAVKLGSAWVDPQYIRQFIIETLKPDFFTEKAINVTYSEVTDKWKVEGWQKSYNNTLSTETYGTADMNAYQIIEATLNMKKVEIRERVKDEQGNFIRDDKGKYILQTNQEKTMIVQAKQDELKRKFQEWIFADPDRREKLVTLYNEKFNSTRLREYDGSNLHFVGMNSAITLSEHQKNAIARDLYSNGNTLLAHEVGAGKTFEMIAIAMEGKRLGLHSKSLITAPNALTEQWGEAFRTLYPNANVLVATEKDFQTENRRDLFAKIATGDWDAVIIGHSQFDMIHLSKERELEVLYSEVEKLESALNEMTDENGKKSFSVKQVEKAIKSYENKIETLLSKTPEDDMLCFEKLGVDKIFVDESQNYKNLDTPSKMQNVAGLGSGGAGKSMQLLMKCKYLDEITGGKGIVFASGTPISNSMAEMYTLMRYLQADKLQELGINSFDQWASVFGETTTSMELSPEGNGKYQSKTRFAKFQNLPELMNIFKECADIKTAASLNLDRPDFEMHNVNVPATRLQAQMIKGLGERAKAIRSGKVEPTEDNMCKLTVDGRKIGLDQRCMNPDLPDDPNSKVNVCINNVFDIWQRTAEQKGTQLIFCDLATPQPSLNENSYKLYRKDTDGSYNSVYTAKLGKKDTAEKILKRFNSSKPPKNFKAGGAYDEDVIVLQNVNYDDGMAYNKAFIVENGNLKELSAGEKTWEQLPISPAEPFDSQRRFCVYDDIKQKLVEKGVPEKEIAFIHEVDKAEDKQKLFDKMNKGEIRVMIGSTTKCGAGMNAQQRMIALHDLDAPMRPSDMEQRHGRIIRQGNENSKVDIYRYTTDKTFDAYLYQMLENKQKFISQIMTDKSPVRSCEDVDEIALDYAEVKALCAGNPLIKEKIDLETDITKLNVLKSSFLSQKYSLEDKAYKTLPEWQRIAELRIQALKMDIDSVNNIQPLTDKDGKNYYPVTVNGAEYHDKEQAGEAIRQAILKSGDILEGKERVIGSYRGFEMSAFIDNLNKVVKVNLKGEVSHYGEINMNKDVKASGNIIRLDNIINGIEPELIRQEERLQSIKADIEEAKIAAEAVFPHEQELNTKETRLAEVNVLLSSSDVSVKNNVQELYAALVEICPELENYHDVYCKYEVGKDSGIEPLCVEKHGDIVFIAHTYVQNGKLMYDPAIEFEFDTDTKSAKAISYEMSGMGIYTTFSDGNNLEEREDVESLFLDTMSENIRTYNYERIALDVSSPDEPEKEIVTNGAR
ncbi:MAG: AAA family ATPase [Oscillospiraceae bacterium]|nr:AAA family ATPase [Oscillospiraceae bacterium]